MVRAPACAMRGLPDLPAEPAPAQVGTHDVEAEKGEAVVVVDDEIVAAGLPSSSPIRKPSASTVAKQAASFRPGFQPSAAAQSAASAISPARIGRIV